MVTPGAGLPTRAGPPAGTGEGGPRGGRGPIIVAIVAGSIALIMVVVLIVVLLAGGDDSNVQAQPHPTATRVSTTTTTSDTRTTPAVPELEVVARQIEAQLNTSATGRHVLIDQVLGPYRDCRISAAEADIGIDSVIANREGILTSLDSLSTGHPTARNLVDLLRTAIQHSLDSNFQWKAWIQSSGFGCPPGNTADEDAAEFTSDNLATPAKQAFVNAYNPVAASYGLPQWDDKGF